jgi:hypothetical protein
VDFFPDPPTTNCAKALAEILISIKLLSADFEENGTTTYICILGEKIVTANDHIYRQSGIGFGL